MKSWYEAKTGNHQGLIIEEQTGENIAVVYKKENAALIAAAPELYEMLKSCLGLLEDYSDGAQFLAAHELLARIEGLS